MTLSADYPEVNPAAAAIFVLFVVVVVVVVVVDVDSNLKCFSLCTVKNTRSCCTKDRSAYLEGQTFNILYAISYPFITALH